MRCVVPLIPPSPYPSGTPLNLSLFMSSRGSGISEIKNLVRCVVPLIPPSPYPSGTPLNLSLFMSSRGSGISEIKNLVRCVVPPPATTEARRVQWLDLAPLLTARAGHGLVEAGKFTPPPPPRSRWSRQILAWCYITCVDLTLCCWVLFSQYRTMKKKAGKILKPWLVGSLLRVMNESYLMNTNMTGFRWFSKFFASLCFG